MAKDITRGIITPGAQEIAKNAVPITEEVSTPGTPQNTAILLKMVQKSTWRAMIMCHIAINNQIGQSRVRPGECLSSHCKPAYMCVARWSL